VINLWEQVVHASCRGRGPVVSCCWTLSSDKHNPCGMRGAGSLETCMQRVVESPGCGGTAVSG
jgi:hypothetical protein